MPFPIIFGCPESASKSLLREIRSQIITDLAIAANIPERIIRPFFPVDCAGDPDEGQDDTIYIPLDSGMFLDKSREERKKSTSAITEILWRAFMGRYEVETIINDLISEGKTLRKPALTTFMFEGNELQVSYVETDDQIAPGVLCDVYNFVGDVTKDLGIILIDQGSSTPLQEVLKGDRTVEGFVSGKGTLVVTNPTGEISKYEFFGVEGDKDFTVDVRVGQTMQWQANKGSDLVVCEVCFPPYEDGRYKNIE